MSEPSNKEEIKTDLLKVMYFSEASQNGVGRLVQDLCLQSRGK